VFDDSPDAEKRPMYTHIVYKAHYDDRCNNQHGINAPAYPQGCMLDPKRIKWRDILEKREAGNYEVVYQQEDVDPAATLVAKEWINGGTLDGIDYEGCWDRDRVIGQLPPVAHDQYVVRYMTVDPSPTMWWGIHDWLYVLPPDVEPMAGRRYLINTLKAKLGANEFLDWSQDQHTYVGVAEDWVAASKRTEYPISYLIMEKNAAQRWAFQYDFFRNWVHRNSISLIQHETERNKTDDEFGVSATLPSIYKFGRVRLPAGDLPSRSLCLPLVNEVTTYPNTSTFDQGMSQWFGEYNLQHLVHVRYQTGTMHPDLPSWMGGRNPRDQIARRLAVAVGR
jgi:hypothetical protein